MRYNARIIGGTPAVPDSWCDVVHLDADGNLLDRQAVCRLVLSTSIGERFVDLCGAHEDAVGADLARWSHPVEPGQSAVEGHIDGILTAVLSESVHGR